MEYCYLNNIQSSDLWSWDVFAFIRCIFTFFKQYFGTFLVVQWLGLHAPNAGGKGLIPDWETKIIPTCCMAWPKRKKKKTRCFDTVMLSHPCIYTTGVNKSQLIVFLCWICFTSIFLELLEHIDCFSSNSGQTLFLQIYFVCFEIS